MHESFHWDFLRRNNETAAKRNPALAAFASHADVAARCSQRGVIAPSAIAQGQALGAGGTGSCAGGCTGSGSSGTGSSGGGCSGLGNGCTGISRCGGSGPGDSGVSSGDGGLVGIGGPNRAEGSRLAPRLVAGREHAVARVTPYPVPLLAADDPP
jgi:hypothetical protein